MSNNNGEEPEPRRVMDPVTRTEEEQRLLALGLAAHQVVRLEKNSAVMSEQLVKTSNWLSAALLAINGGGAIATLNAADKISGAEYPAFAFATGILFVLLSGVSLQAFQAKSAQPIENLMAYWRAVAILGIYNDNEEMAFNGPVVRSQRFSWLPPALGWVSGVCFFVGAMFLAMGVESRQVGPAAPTNAVLPRK